MTSWAAGVAAAFTRTLLVMTQHVPLVDHPARVVQQAQRAVWAGVGGWLLRRSAKVFVLNDTVAAFVAGHGVRADRICHLPNGVDGKLFTPSSSNVERRALRLKHRLPQDRVLVLFAGRLVPKKGYDLLLAAADPAFDLVFAGDGHKDAPATETGIHYLGRLGPPEMAEVYRACDMFALPSTSEGFPLTVQEAMSAGLPVLTTDDPGYAPYRLDRRQVQLLPRDSTAYHDVLTGLAADPARRSAMSHWSRLYAAEAFSWSGHADALLRHYSLVSHAAAAPVGRNTQKAVRGA
jgi:glycosyltransferase involved in cell wall biosynthesis